MVRIPIQGNNGKDKFALIDEVDLPLVKDYTWHLSLSRYAQAKKGSRKNRTNYLMHRLIMNPPRGVSIDHKNGDGLDNRRSNLRMCTQLENNRNSRKRMGTTSRYKGVNLYRDTLSKPWRAYIRLNKKGMHLGYYETEKEATTAYNKAATQYFGEFSHLNVVQ